MEAITEDPNDPRNWTPLHKNTTYITICLFSFIANVNASAFTVAVRTLIQAFHISLTEATSITALNVLTFGLGNILWVPLMRVLGKRPVYLMAILLLVVANAWSATAASYGSLLASRIISGIGASAADATVPSAVGDLWTQETRGHRAMIFHLFLASGVFLGPLINAWVIQLHGWRWVPGWISIVSGIIFLLATFLKHETEYRRDRHQPLRTTPEPRSFLAWLSPTIALQRDRPMKAFWQSFKDILTMLSYPQILYSSIIIGIFVGWTIIMQISLSQTLSSPPYSWSLGHVGYFHFAGWIGVLIALPTAGFLLDKYMAHRRRQANLGKGDPRHRLPFLVGPWVVAPTGLVFFGVLLGRKDGWVGPAVGYAMHSFGFAAVSNILVSYCLEMNLLFSGEGLVSLFVIRNAIAVACTYGAGAGGWLSGGGGGGAGVVGGEARWTRAFVAMGVIEWVGVGFAVVVFLFSRQMMACTQRYGPGLREMERERSESGASSVQEQGMEMSGGLGRVSEREDA